MGQIGQKFESGDYFLSELLMSADLFSKAMEILEPRLQETAMDTIVAKNVFSSKGGDLVAVADARIVSREVTDLDIL